MVRWIAGILVVSLFGAAQQSPSPTPTSSSALGSQADSCKIVLGGTLIQKVEPNYPAAAIQNHTRGKVIIIARIGKDGIVRSAKATSGPPILREAAEEAARQWVYAPHTCDGQPIEVEATITFSFQYESADIVKRSPSSDSEHPSAD